MFHIAELETAVRCKLPLVCVVGVDNAWGLEVGVYKRTFGQGTAETGTHWSKDVRFDKIGVKDSGTILPGHGGFLDRFDAFIFCIPFVFVFYMIVLLLK